MGMGRMVGSRDWRLRSWRTYRKRVGKAVLRIWLRLWVLLPLRVSGLLQLWLSGVLQLRLLRTATLLPPLLRTAALLPLLGAVAFTLPLTCTSAATLICPDLPEGPVSNSLLKKAQTRSRGLS